MRRLKVKWGTLATPIGKGGKFAAKIKSFCRFFYFHCALPIGRVRIAGHMVFAKHKGNERIGKEQMPI
jgi:hypothetical protein